MTVPGNGDQNGTGNGQQQQQNQQPAQPQNPGNTQQTSSQQQQYAPPQQNPWSPNPTSSGGHYGSGFSDGSYFGELRQTLQGLPEAVSRAVRESFPTGAPESTPANPQNANQGGADPAGNNAQNGGGNNPPANPPGNSQDGGNEVVTPGRNEPNRFAKWWFGL